MALARRLSVSAALWVLLTFVSAGAAAAPDPVARVSEVVTTPADAWHEPGFRLQGSIGYEALPSWRHVPRGAGIALGLGTGWQVDAAWSVDVSMTYIVFLPSTGFLTGMRWSADVGPTWHPWQGVRLGAAAGFANILANWSIDPEVYAPQGGFCDGPTAHGMLHAGYLIAISEAFAMGPSLQAGLAYTKCAAIDTTGALQNVPAWPTFDIAAAWVLSGR